MRGRTTALLPIVTPTPASDELEDKLKKPSPLRLARLFLFGLPRSPRKSRGRRPSRLVTLLLLLLCSSLLFRRWSPRAQQADLPPMSVAAAEPLRLPRAEKCAQQLLSHLSSALTVTRRLAAASDDELASLVRAKPQTVSPSDRRRAVVAQIAWAWKGYSLHAFGKDELQPLSRSGHDFLHLGLTVVDSLDTLLLAGLDAEYDVARRWVVASLQLEEKHSPEVIVNVFETTIRILGGLLAAHHLTPGGDEQLLAKAEQLAPRLAAACAASPTGLPLSDVVLATWQARRPTWGADSSVSEVSTISLEFSAVAHAAAAAGHDGVVRLSAADVAQGVQSPFSSLDEVAAAGLKAQRAVIAAAARHEGLVVGKFISPADGSFTPPRFSTLGARVDSYYEYLLKGWLHSGKSDEGLLKAYQDAVHAITTQLLQRSDKLGVLYVAEAEHAGGMIRKLARPHLFRCTPHSPQLTSCRSCRSRTTWSASTRAC